MGTSFFADESVCWDEAHRTEPVGCRPITKCGTTGCIGSSPLSVVEYGYAAGNKPATCEICGKTFPRSDVTLSDPSPAESEGIKGNRSRNSSPALFSKSSVVSWIYSPREQSEANGEDAVMKDCTESHQSEINKKIKANDKLRKIFTNMPKEHRTLRSRRKLNHWTMRKLPCWQPKGNSYPCKVGMINRKTFWSESRKRSNRNRRNVRKSCNNGSILIRNWKQPALNRHKPNKRWRCWWLNNLQKMKNCQSRKSRVPVSHVRIHL